MIPGRIRHDAARLLLRGELRQRVEGAAEFECADTLQIFALEEQLRPDLAVRRSRLQHGCDMRDALQSALRRDDVFECNTQWSHAQIVVATRTIEKDIL